MERPKALILCGPTATGKSELAVQLAKKLDAEMVCADSMQVYRELTIGTAAMTPEEAQGVPQHMTGFLLPDKAFSVASWLQMAEETALDINRRGKLPLFCGGTGLYIKSLVEGVRYEPQPDDKGLREQLETEWESQGAEAMLQRLAMLDPERAKVLHTRDKKRILRALALVLLTGHTAARREADSRKVPPQLDCRCIGLDYAERALLYKRCDDRVDAMMQAGLLAEAQWVWKNRACFVTAAQAIGYKELFAYFDGCAELEACVQKLKQATRNYAKRQRTWFRGMPQVTWLEAGSNDLTALALELALPFVGMA